MSVTPSLCRDETEPGNIHSPNRWHHQLNGHEFKQTLEDGEGQRSLACCSLWGAECWTQQLNENKRLLLQINIVKIAINVAS